MKRTGRFVWYQRYYAVCTHDATLLHERSAFNQRDSIDEFLEGPTGLFLVVT